MTDMESRAAQINAFYAARMPQNAPVTDRADIATHAAATRWAGRGGHSTPIRISTLLAARLYEAIPQPDRRAFVEAAITAALDNMEVHNR